MNYQGKGFLNRALTRHNLRLSEPKDPNQYERLAHQLRKRRSHPIVREYSYSFDRFVSVLEILEPV